MRQELTQNIDPRYEVIQIRTHLKEPKVYALVYDSKDKGRKKGLFSEDGGKTYHEVTSYEEFKQETCKECEGSGELMVGKLYPNGHTETNEECENCKGEGTL